MTRSQTSCNIRRELGELTGDGLGTGCTALGEQLAEAVGAVRFLVATSETLTGQRNLAVSACEALAMPWIVLVGDAAGCDDLEGVESGVE